MKEYLLAWLKATTMPGGPIFSGIIFASSEVAKQKNKAKNPCQ